MVVLIVAISLTQTLDGYRPSPLCSGPRLYTNVRKDSFPLPLLDNVWPMGNGQEHTSSVKVLNTDFKELCP